MKVFLDLDGVLVNFVDAACRAHGRLSPYLDKSNVAARGEWNIDQLLGIPAEDFYGVLGFDFWAHLDWMPDGPEILDVVEDMFGAENVCLLTSPLSTAGCVEGKIAWIGKHMPSYRRRFLVGPQKEFLAGPGKILIDDSDVNCDKFAAAGGRAVLVPRPWNQRHTDYEGDGAVIDYLETAFIFTQL